MVGGGPPALSPGTYMGIVLGTLEVLTRLRKPQNCEEKWGAVIPKMFRETNRNGVPGEFAKANVERQI